MPLLKPNGGREEDSAAAAKGPRGGRHHLSHQWATSYQRAKKRARQYISRNSLPLGMVLRCNSLGPERAKEVMKPYQPEMNNLEQREKGIDSSYHMVTITHHII